MDINAPSPAEPVAEWAKMIAENGILVTIAALVLFGAASYLIIMLADLRRRKSGDWIPRDKLLQAVKQQHPDRYLPTIHELPKLTQHPVFSHWEHQLRTVERAALSGQFATDLEKTVVLHDLIRVVLRPTRNLWTGIVNTLYEDLDRFEERLGDETAFKSFVSREYAKLMEITRQQLIHFEFPEQVIQEYGRYMVTSDNIADQMLQQAADHPLNNNYFRLAAVLDTQLARATSIHKMLKDIVRYSDCAGYSTDNSEGRTQSTLAGFQSRSNPTIGDAMIAPDFKYRPDFC